MSAPLEAPQSSRLIRRALAALAGLTVAALLAAVGFHVYRWALLQPVRDVQFAGDVQKLPARDLDALVNAVRTSQNPSLDSVRQAARAVPWVRDASVRRLWPAGVEITFEAFDAVARWNDDRLVSGRGEVFAADTKEDLPRLRGPESTPATMVAALKPLSAALAPLGSPLRELRLSPRGAWQAVLANNFVVELGRGDVLERAQRFAAAWPLVVAQGVQPTHADLRYPNGFALQAPKPSNSDKKTTGKKA